MAAPSRPSRKPPTVAEMEAHCDALIAVGKRRYGPLVTDPMGELAPAASLDIDAVLRTACGLAAEMLEAGARGADLMEGATR